MGTRGYEYNQICICIHILMGSQIPVYYARGYPFGYSHRARDGFYQRISVSMGIFATPSRMHHLKIHVESKRHMAQKNNLLRGLWNHLVPTSEINREMAHSTALNMANF
jgi:hypothetical protein